MAAPEPSPSVCSLLRRTRPALLGPGEDDRPFSRGDCQPRSTGAGPRASTLQTVVIDSGSSTTATAWTRTNSDSESPPTMFPDSRLIPLT